MTSSFVSGVDRISKPPALFHNGGTINFKNGQKATLPAGSQFADDVLFAIRARRPLLVKTTPEQVISFAGPAWISGVNRTKRIKQGLLVFLRGRSSALLLQAQHDNFDQLAGLFIDAAREKRVLAVAQVPGTTTITDAIPSTTEVLSGERIRRARRPPPVRLRPTTLAHLTRAMTSFRRAQCAPTAAGISPQSRCIPFNYPKNGCNGRAAYMCAALKQRGISSGKVFCFPATDEQLVAVTQNEPCGRASWEFHVAAIANADGIDLVIDPALSDTPLTIPAWNSLISGGKRTEVVVTAAFVLGLDQPDGRGTWSVHYDTRGARATAELADARETLSRRSKLDGPPPYPTPIIDCESDS